jgi:hypothetical protein
MKKRAFGRFVAVGLSGLAVIVAGCSAGAGDDGPSQSHEGEAYLPPVAESATPAAATGHALRKAAAKAEAERPELRVAASGPHLTYYGGKVLSDAKIVAVLWGSKVDSTTASKIGGFFSTVTNSAYFDWLSEYDTPTQKIGRGSFAGTVTITPKNTATSLTDAQIQAELTAQVAAGKLAEPDANTLYMLYFPPGVTITMDDGSQSCVVFCAYHNTFKSGSKEFFYGIMPDFGAGSGCDTGCGDSKVTFDNLTSASSHEMIEATTDAEVGLATVLGKPLAWYDQNNGEIGDICNGVQGTIDGYTVQKEWSNKENACIVTGPSTPPKSPVVNGDFETGTLSGWTAEGVASVVSSGAHGGKHAAELGSTKPSLASAISQTFTLPSGTPKLSFWYESHCTDTVKYDWATATLRDDVTGKKTVLLAPTCAKTAKWTQVVTDVSASAGHKVTLTLENVDDDYPGDASYTLFDDVTVE